MKQVSKNSQIEGLRGFGILLVALYHLTYKMPGDSEQAEALHNILTKIPLMGHWGQIGVGIFFIISAYFLFSIKGFEGLKKYYSKKLLRIWPVYVVSITVTYLASLFLAFPDYGRSFSDYLLNIFFINGFIDTAYIDGAHWYLTALISFILITGLLKQLRIDQEIWPYLAWVCVAALSKGISLALLTVNSSWISAFGLFFGLIYKICGGGFIGYAVVGILLHMKDDGLLVGKKKYWAIASIVCSLGYTLVTTNYWRIISMLLAVILIELCIHQKAKLFDFRILVTIGTFSYPFYLCHQEIGYFVEWQLQKLSLPIVLCIMSAFLVAGVIAMGLAWIDSRIHRR